MGDGLNDYAEMPKPVLGGDWIEAHYRMRSGAPNGEERFRIAVGKHRIWVYLKDVASPIYCSGGKGSDGFGGREITFKLEDTVCGSITLKGPWSSNTDSFYTDAGIDYRAKHYTYVVIGRGMTYEIDHRGNLGRSIITDIVYFDPSPIQGPFSRGDALVQEWADKLGTVVSYHISSISGSQKGTQTPSRWTSEQVKWYFQNRKECFDDWGRLRKRQQIVRDAWIAKIKEESAQEGDEEEGLDYPGRYDFEF